MRHLTIAERWVVQLLLLFGLGLGLGELLSPTMVRAASACENDVCNLDDGDCHPADVQTDCDETTTIAGCASSVCQ